VKVVRTIANLRAALDPGPGRAPSIGLVPTMGALHAGHLSLIEAARGGCERVVVSLFVNPAQFGRGEDLEAYPRDEASDIAAAEAAGVDVLFAPDAQQMYPDGFDTWVDPGKVGTFLEGSARPGHFRGVATVCAKLFLLAKPQRAYFGRKDAQQLAVVSRMAADLNLPVEVVGCPLVREADGLALSSRNAYLKPAERDAALVLSRALRAAADAIVAGEREAACVETIVRDTVATEPLVDLEYVDVRDATELTALTRLDGEVLVALAARVGKTRLIDNVGLVVDGDRARARE
jgi:pantoate--beta-alanine ligase